MLNLPALFSDNMVLQQGLPAPIWGRAAPGEKITLTVAGQSVSAVADAGGKWLAHLGPLKPGGPMEIQIASGERKIILRNVLVGEVWLCSGQSNMEFTVGQARDAAAEIASADFPLIRHFKVANTAALSPLEAVVGAWSVCSPRDVANFTAVGYFFARKLHRDLNVPIGLINSSWGGTVAQTWTSRAALAAEPQLKYMADFLDMSEEKIRAIAAESAQQMAQWDAAVSYEDPGNTGFDKGWAQTNFDDRSWKIMDLPRFWETVPGMEIDGAVWFRKEILIPPDWAAKDLALSLGPIDDYDTTYFNGEKIGGIGREAPNWWVTPRNYRVPAALVRPGRAVIAVRVFDRMINGGIWGGGHPMSLGVPNDPSPPLRLEGPWKYHVELALQPKPLIPGPATAASPGQINAPAALFNAMIAPLIPVAIRGAIWYQGESNAERAREYRVLFPALIRDWRRRWGREFPFLFTQLTNFMPRESAPCESTWAELRDSQLKSLDQPNIAMAVTIDIGQADDIHPVNKQDVGLRLALAAEATVYGKKIVYSGPVYDSMSIEGSRIRLHFQHVGGGLRARGKLEGFAIAGEDRKFIWADAEIDGSAIVVSQRRIANPVAVRYAWQNNPPCTLYNAEGLPASPFRTDSWPGIGA